jgi:hypothetical protein
MDFGDNQRSECHDQPDSRSGEYRGVDADCVVHALFGCEAGIALIAD